MRPVRRMAHATPVTVGAWRRVLGVVAALTLVGLRAPVAHATCPTVDIVGAVWCGDVPFYWGTGLNGACQTGNCINWRAAIRAAVTEWNLTSASEFELPILLQESGSLADETAPAHGIVFTYGDKQLGIYANCTNGLGSTGEGGPCGGTMPPGVHFAVTKWDFSVPTSGNMAVMERACIHISGDVPWVNGASGGVDRKSVALHEIGHALGLGHATGGTCLMEQFGGCNAVHGIDGSAPEAAYCLYGTLFGSCSQRWSVLPFLADDGSTDFLLATCECFAGCSSPQPLTAAARTYELAVSESDGPYTVFATVAEADLVNRTYSHDFPEAYASARFRLRVYDGGTQVGESTSPYPTSIPGPASVVSGLTSGFALRCAPNPMRGETAITFQTGRSQRVEVSIHDAAGRRVATLQEGWLPAGEHRLGWAGRGAVQAPSWYRCVVRTERDGGASRSVVLLR